MNEDTARDGEQEENLGGERLSDEPRPLSTKAVTILAALSRRPFGFRSIADISRATGMSINTAVRVLQQLQKDRLVRLDHRISAEWGKARKTTVWMVNLRPRVLRMLPDLSLVQLPDVWEALPPATRVPHRFWHHFWNADPAELALPEDAHFVADRLLLSSDPSAWGWALNCLPVGSLVRVARSRGADPRTRALIRNFVSART